MQTPHLSQSSLLYFLPTLVHRRSDPFIAIEHSPRDLHVRHRMVDYGVQP